MAVQENLKEERYFFKTGDVEFDFTTINGIGLPPFPSSLSKGGWLQRVRDIQNLECRPDDVLLATYPKCGTHWTAEILNMLLRGNSDYVKETKVGGMLEFIPSLEMIEPLQSPRVLNSHLPYKWLPKKFTKGDGKIIYTTRNPKDALVSMYYFSLEGLYYGPKTKHMSWSQFFDHVIMGKTVLYGTWFDYAKEMEKAKTENKNIYTIQYEAVKENPSREIKSLAKFLGVSASDDLIAKIASKCEFQNLKKATEEVKQLPPGMVKMMEERLKEDPDYKPPNIYRKGIVGDWKEHFTESQNKQFDALFEKEMKGCSVPVTYG